MKRMTLLWSLILILIGSLNLLSCGSGGSDGSGGTPDKLLDTSFGTGGKVTTALGIVEDTPYAMAVQSDDKLVVAGYSYDGTQYFFAVVRYNTDGTLDTTFNSGGAVPGIVTTDIGGIDDRAFAIAIQPSDEKLVIAGRSSNGSQNVFALARYNTDGSLDGTFNPLGTVPGIVTTTIGGDDAARALIVQPNGKLVAAGYSYNNGTNAYEFTLARYNTDGSLDTTFNSAGALPGTATTPIGAIEDVANSLAIQSDNKLVAAGYSYNSINGANEFVLVRYNTDGSLDTTGFGTGGIVTTIVGANDAANALVIQPSDDKLVAAGYSYNSTTGGFEFALARYNTDGTLDTTFNPAGTNPGAMTTTFGTIDDEVNALLVQPDGKLVAAGYSDTGTRFIFALARYNTDGTLDTTFNSTGKITTDVGNDDSAQAIVLQGGKLVAAGYSLQGTQYKFALVRYLPIP